MNNKEFCVLKMKLKRYRIPFCIGTNLDFITIGNKNTSLKNNGFGDRFEKYFVLICIVIGTLILYLMNKKRVSWHNEIYFYTAIFLYIYSLIIFFSYKMRLKKVRNVTIRNSQIELLRYGQTDSCCYSEDISFEVKIKKVFLSRKGQIWMSYPGGKHKIIVIKRPLAEDINTDLIYIKNFLCNMLG